MKFCTLGVLWAALALASTPSAGQPRYVSTLAGSPAPVVRSIDATGSAAQFFEPRGVAVDPAGNLIVADSGNHTIRRITPAGVVTTLAGSPGVQGLADGTGAAARFTEPFAVAVDTAGIVYVADTSNNAIRRITPDGVVSTLAGGRGMGSADGTGSAASFREPRGIVVDRQGQIIVVDYMNHTLRKLSPAGVVTTLAGLAGSEGSSDGSGSSARFRGPNGIAIDSAGNLYVADTGNRALRKITPAGVVSTAAVSPPGSAATARFNMPRGVAVDGSGQVYMADHGAHTLLKVSSTGVISTLAGSADSADSRDGSGSAARFFNPSGLAVDGLGNVVLADTSNHTVRRISPAGAATTVAGLAGRSSSVDGTGLAARFEDPYALAIDSSGQTWVADATDHSIRKVSASGVVTTVAGAAGQHGSADGAGSAARFFTPQGIAVDTQGNAYVADSGNATVRKISAAGVVSTLAGSPGLRGRTDGTGAQARFGEPYGVAVDRAGNVYVADTGNSNIRKITSAGVVSTLAGSGTPGLVDGIGLAAQFLVPFDLAVDADGNVYVCDHGSHAVRKITPAGVVTTLAGGAGPGRDDGTGRAARFQFPSGIAVDAAGTVYLADTDNQALRQISPAGVVTTLAGGQGVGWVNGIGAAAKFFNPKDVAVDAAGQLVVADRGNHVLRLARVLSTAVSADCLFDWAEQHYAELFAPPASSLLLAPYRYRAYTGTQTYLGVSDADAQVWYLSAAGLQAVGSQDEWFVRAACR